MALREEIAKYIDQYGLVAPNIPGPTGRGSDNGPRFTSEYFVMLKKMGDFQEEDAIHFNWVVGNCIDHNGLLSRAPGDPDQEGPDDFYSVLNGCKHVGNTAIPRKMLWAVIKYLGFLNNNSPGQKTASSFLVRQPQLIAAMISAAFPSYWNPLHWLIRILAFPFYFVAAVTIFISCIGAPASDTDGRALSWHLLQTVAPISIMCKLASLFWYHRLYSIYGVAGMRGVAKLYYSPGHPFSKYWVD